MFNMIMMKNVNIDMKTKKTVLYTSTLKKKNHSELKRNQAYLKISSINESLCPEEEKYLDDNHIYLFRYL